MSFDAAKLRVPPGSHEPLRHHDPGETLGLGDKDEAVEALAELLPRMREYQDRLNAQRTWSMLVILQAMDAAGKDGVIKHVLAGLNQQSCHVTSFSAPAGAEVAHTFLWRCVMPLPPRGHIAVYNRSYYEEVLVPRIHTEYLEYQRIPPECFAGDITAAKNANMKARHTKLKIPPTEFWQARFDDINAFERHLVRNGTRVVKFYLNLSREEQKRRFLQRIDDPARNWKFSPADARDRHYWNQYHHAYSEMLSATSTRFAPWHIIPADYKYIARLAVARVLFNELRALDPRFPKLDETGKKALKQARKMLEDE